MAVAVAVAVVVAVFVFERGEDDVLLLDRSCALWWSCCCCCFYAYAYVCSRTAVRRIEAPRRTVAEIQCALDVLWLFLDAGPVVWFAVAVVLYFSSHSLAGVVDPHHHHHHHHHRYYYC